MQIVPLSAMASQTETVLLGNQACQINVYQKSTGLFLDLYVSAVLTIGGVLCLNANRIVRSTYLGFDGDLAFFDMQGLEDPTYDGLGGRFQLVYLTPDELATVGVT